MVLGLLLLPLLGLTSFGAYKFMYSNDSSFSHQELARMRKELHKENIVIKDQKVMSTITEAENLEDADL